MTNHSDSYNLITILGPTASGKTKLAAELAYRLNTEIISADSRQVYRRMDLGTGKDYKDYIVNGITIPVHLIDIHDPGYKYNVFEYQKDFLQVYNKLRSNSKIPILCSGTGMYIEAITKRYKLIAVPVNEELRIKLAGKSLEELKNRLAEYKTPHNKTDTDTIKRAIRAIEIEDYYIKGPDVDRELPEIIPIYIGVKYERELRRKNISERLTQRLGSGMIEEVSDLINEGVKPDDLIYYGLEYKYITLYLTGNIDYNTMFSKLNIAIHQFAKRQMTWFRKMEREGCNIHWLDAQMPMEEKIKNSLEILDKQ